MITVEYRFVNVPGPFAADTPVIPVRGQEFGSQGGGPPGGFIKGFGPGEPSLINPPDFNNWNWTFNQTLSHVISSVIPSGGQPDSCGNLPTFYPAPPPLPPGGETWNVTIYDNDDTPLDLPLNYVDVDFNFPITFQFEGGLINVDLGGINIEWNGDINIGGGGGEPDSRNPYRAPPESDKWYLPDSIDLDDPNVEEKPPREVSEDQPVSEEPEEDEKIVYVEILMITPPDEKHRILYKEPIKNVYYGGWLTWTKGEGGLNSAPDIPIRRSRTVLRRPDDYTGYTMRAINGATYQIRSYTIKTKNVKST